MPYVKTGEKCGRKPIYSSGTYWMMIPLPLEYKGCDRQKITDAIIEQGPAKLMAAKAKSLKTNRGVHRGR